MVGELPQSPRYHGRPQSILNTSQTFMVEPTTFKKWGDLRKEVVEKGYTSSWLYQDNRPTPNLPMEDDNKGLQLMLKWGYNKMKMAY